VVNVTDVDDKLIAESAARGVSMAQLAEEMTADYLRNIAALGVDTIDHFPRCTENIGEIIDFVGTLIERGFAYRSDGDVYFDVGKDADYGKLSGRAVEAMQGEGGAAGQRKHSAADFALWKAAKPGEPSWPSPWGPGRPGWHIECSAMSRRLLGRTFDIHGGGLDLVFPHHENEIAQSESAHGQPMAKYWMHNGLMQASDEVGKVGGRSTRPAATAAGTPAADDLEAQQAGKISKSKGSAAFRELLAEFAPQTIRFFLLATHYRRPIDYGPQRLRETQAAVENFYRFFKRYERASGGSFYAIRPPQRRQQGDFDPGGRAPACGSLLADVAGLRERFLEAMDDDFNTGGAIGDLFDLVRRLNKFIDDEGLEQPENRSDARLASLRRGTAALRELAAVLGLFGQPPQPARPFGCPAGHSDLVARLMDLLVDLRSEARARKDFATADRIRKGLSERGITLEDRPGGTEWTLQKET
jgi:cysteinyl-tRNA synthetase